MTDPPTLLALAAAVSSLLLASLTWVVHLVVYPAFALVGPGEWAAYHAAHTRRITLVVAPSWAVQGASALALLVARPAGAPTALALAHAALVAVPVAVTVLASVPAHRRLGAGPDPAALARLQASDRLRVAAWSASAVTGTALLLAASG